MDEELVKRLNEAFDRVGKTFDQNAKTLDDYNKEVNKGRRSILSLGPALKDMKEAIEDQEEALKDTTKTEKERKEIQDKVNTTQKTYNDTMKKFVNAQVMNGLAQAIVTGGAAFVNGSREMAFTAIRGMQAGQDSIQAASDIFTAEIERNANMARAAFEAVAQAGSSIPLKMGLAAELAGRAGVELTNQIAILNKEGVNVLNTELTKTKNNFNAMASSGAYFTGGMTEMRNSAGAAGMRLDDFGKFASNAASDLRLFGATQAGALKQVGGVTNAMGSQVNAQLRNIGYTQAEIAEGTAEYMANLARTGSLAGKSQEQLAKESSAYLTNMKVISSITGEDAKAAQKRANDAAMQSAVQAQLASMGGDATAKFQELIKVMPGMETAISQIMLTGSTTNAAVINSPLFDIIKNAIAGVKDSSVAQGQVMVGVQDQLKAAGPALQQTIQEFSAAGVGALFGQNSAFATELQGLVTMLQQTKRSGSEAKGAVDGQKTTTDKLTQETVKLQQQFEKASIFLENDLTKSLKGFATQLQNTFTDVDKYVKTALNLMIDKKGVKTPNSESETVPQALPGGGYEPGGGLVQDETNIAAATGAVLTGPTSGYKPNLTMHGTEAIVPLAGGGVPVVSPALSDLSNLRPALTELMNSRNAPVESAALTELVSFLKASANNTNSSANNAQTPSLNLAPLVEKMAESNRLLRSQLDMHQRMTTTIEDGNAINKQILSVTR
jgi:hypothetical protein